MSAHAQNLFPVVSSITSLRCSSFRRSSKLRALRKIALLAKAEVFFHALNAFAALSTAFIASSAFTHLTLYYFRRDVGKNDQ